MEVIMDAENAVKLAYEYRMKSDETLIYEYTKLINDRILESIK